MHIREHFVGAFVIFILNRFIFRILEFIWHWYVGTAKVYGHFVISVLERLDRFFALKITFRNIFQPLYQDKSVLGYILGFILRLARITTGGIVYCVLIALFFAAYLFWAAIPLIIILKAVNYRYSKLIF
ncbi:MAG: hypothetical protein QMD86_02785 [Patescibacteria group bacterium]|nr:hypothetical protein [Patescibacteria group bacterium]